MNSFIRLLSLFVLASAFGPLARADGKPSSQGDTVKVVVHVDFADADRQKHGLGNVTNMLNASGNKITIEVVAHGEGLPMLVSAKSSVASEIKELMTKGVTFAACEHTMKKDGVTKAQLLPGVTPVPSGAFEVVKKQSDGYSYFKPG